MWVVVVLGLLSVACTHAEGDVTDLTVATFDDFVKENQYVLVEFFAPWCGHCKQLVPEYAKAATALKEYGVQLAAVDATIHSSLGTKFDVKGYPTLKFFRDGQVSDYSGGRTSSTIITWILKAINAPLKKIETAAAAKAFVASSKIAVIGFFSESSSADIQEFVSASQLDDSLFATANSESVATELGISFPSVALFRSSEDTPVVFSGPFVSKDISDFVSAEKLPAVIPFTMEVAQDIFTSKLGKVAFFFGTTENPSFREVAANYRGKLVFSTSDGSVQRLNDHLGISASDIPLFIVLSTQGQMLRFPYSGELTTTGMSGHIDAFLANTLSPTLKSEELPASNSEPVKVVVGKSFDEIVLDPTKNVMLEIYAPWCGHCKSLAPIFDELATSLASRSDIVIAKMDGTLNEVNGISVRGFPTLKFYPAGNTDRTGLDYQGGRDLESLKSYLLEHSGANGTADSDGHTSDEL